MMRPKAAVSLLAQVAALVPARLAKKLDADPKVAQGWSWGSDAETWSVRTDADAIVSLTPRDGVVGEPTDVRCTCLLSPRCFHVLAVVAALDVEDGASTREDIPRERTSDGAEAVALAPEQVAAGRSMWIACVDLLAIGAHGAGAVVQGELLRAVHEARSVGLHRVAAAALGVVRRIRELRDEKPEFSAHALVDAITDALLTSSVLSRDGPVSAEWVGVARRSYDELGGLRIVGLACEPVVAASGYAGVVTYCADDAGRIWTISDVAPGQVARARAAYDATVALGDTGLSHRELVRAGLFVQGATGSLDGRLGAGGGVKAVRAAGAAWSNGPMAARFAVPFAEQMAGVASTLDLALESRRAGDLLVFLRAAVVGLERAGIIARVPSGKELLLGTSLEHEALPLRDNLRRLGWATDLTFLALARVPERGERLELIAVGAPPDAGTDGPRLTLPSEWGGVCNVGFDVLQGAHVTDGAPARMLTRDAPLDPLGGLERWLVRVALHGRSAILSTSASVMERDARVLERRMMPTAAALLDTLARASSQRDGADTLAAAWMSCAVYERAARRVLAWA